MRLRMLGLAFALALSLATPTIAQSPPAAPERSVSVVDQRLTVKIGGRDLALAARVYRPTGPGPFPLVVINHGTPVKEDDRRKAKPGYGRAARWFAAQGFVVVVALRPGFGDSEGSYLEEGDGPCQRRDYAQEGRRTAAVEAAIVTAASSLPDVDNRRIVVVGQSTGGFGAITLADQPPAGVLGVISFAGGRGGDDHEHICGGSRLLVVAADELGRANRVPQLWLYAANDHFFPSPLGHAMFQAYQAETRQPMRFVDLPAFNDDGHRAFAQGDPSIWSAEVSAFLKDVLKINP